MYSKSDYWVLQIYKLRTFTMQHEKLSVISKSVCDEKCVLQTREICN